MGIIVALLTGLIFYLQLDEMRTDERGWIGVHIEQPAFPVTGHALVAKLHVKNIGKTPAKHAVIWSAIEVIKTTEAPDFANPPKHTHDLYRGLLGDIYPNDEINVTFDRENKDSVTLPLTDTEYTDLVAGNAYLSVFGRVFYPDIFGKRHDRVFCFWFPFKDGPSYTAATCTDHNTEDDPKR